MIFGRKEAREQRKKDFFCRKIWRVRIQCLAEAYKGDGEMHKEKAKNAWKELESIQMKEG